MRTLITFLIVILISGCAHNKIQFVKLKSTRENSERSNRVDQITNHNVVSLEDEVASLNDDNLYYPEASVKKPQTELNLPEENKTIIKANSTHIKTTQSAHNKSKTVASGIDIPIQGINKRANGDAYLYGFAALIALSSFGIAKAARKTTMKLSRWAATHKKKTRVALALAQIGMAFLGYQTGLELKYLGYEISNNAQFIAGGIGGLTFLGFLLNDLLVKDAWTTFFRRKFGMAIVGASLFATSLGIGNGLEANVVVNSPISYSVQSMTNESDDGLQTAVSSDETRKTKELIRLKIGLYVFFAIILGLLLLGGGCLIICHLGALGIVIVVFAASLYILFHILMVRSIRKSKRQLAAEMNRTDH